MTEREKIHAGVLFQPMDPQILAEQLAYLDKMDAYNRIPRIQMEQRRQMLPELFA